MAHVNKMKKPNPESRKILLHYLHFFLDAHKKHQTCNLFFLLTKFLVLGPFLEARVFKAFTLPVSEFG